MGRELQSAAMLRRFVDRRLKLLGGKTGLTRQQREEWQNCRILKLALREHRLGRMSDEELGQLVHGMAGPAKPCSPWFPQEIWEPLIALAMFEPRAEREEFVKMFRRATARPGRRTPEKCYQEALKMWATVGTDGKHPPLPQIVRKHCPDLKYPTHKCDERCADRMLQAIRIRKPLTHN